MHSLLNCADLIGRFLSNISDLESYITPTHMTISPKLFVMLCNRTRHLILDYSLNMQSCISSLLRNFKLTVKLHGVLTTPQTVENDLLKMTYNLLLEFQWSSTKLNSAKC